MTPTEPSRTEPLDAIDSDSGRQTRLRRGLVTAAVVLLGLAAAGATGAALAGASDGEASFAAATGTPTADEDEQGGDANEKDGRRGGMRGRGHLLGAGGALHGEFVVPDPAGGYRTMLTQRGTASKVSDTSITVRSEDGYTQTYAITADTGVGADRDGVDGIENGADVMVVAQQKGGTATALQVADLADWGPGHRLGRGPGDEGERMAPSPSTTAEGSSYGV